MLQISAQLTPRELGVAELALDRAIKIAPASGPEPVPWLAVTLRRHKSFSTEGRVASLLAALRPIRAVLYLRALAEPLHLSRREVKEALRTLETSGFIRTAPTIRTGAIEVTIVAQNTLPAPQSAPLASNQPLEPRKARRRPGAR